MIILDTALEERERQGRPVRVGLVGAGYMGRGIAVRMLAGMRGLRLVAIANAHLHDAIRTRLDLAQERLDLSSRLQSPLPIEARLTHSVAQC